MIVITNSSKIRIGEMLKQMMDPEVKVLLDPDGDDLKDATFFKGTFAEILEKIAYRLLEDGEFGGFTLMSTEEAEKMFEDNTPT